MKDAAIMMEQRVGQADAPVQSQETVAPAVPSPAGFWQRLASRVRSWFEIPFGYEDEYGFHFGHEPVTYRVSARPANERSVFTDRACDAMRSPSPAPPPPVEAPVEERRQTA